MASSGSESEYEVDYIQKSRKRGRGTEYLVRWKGFGEEEDSWEPEKNLKAVVDQLEAFKNKGVSKTKQVKEAALSKTSSSRSSKRGTGSTVTKTTTTVTKEEMFSDDDLETPRVTRRSTRTEKITKSAGNVGNATTKKSCWFRMPCSSACPSMCTALRNDLPFLIFFMCMVFIAGTFVWEKYAVGAK